MSTRYVWNRYNIITTNELVGSERTAYAVSTYSGKYIYDIDGSAISSVARPIYYHVTNNVQEFFNSEAAITFEGSISNTGTINIPAGNYIAFSTTYIATPGEGSFYYRAPDTGGSTVEVHRNFADWFIAIDTGASPVSCYEVIVQQNKSQGSLIGPVSGSSQGPYPPCPAVPPGSW